MNYFIDFEATQFTNEIISIGCVSERGDIFYSLVKPSKMKYMTKFITDLTGITKEALQNAPTATEVFEKFFDWLPNGEEEFTFFCYGDCDIRFIKKTSNTVKSKKSLSALSILYNKIVDFSPRVKSHFGLAQNVGLVKVYSYYKNIDVIKQNHNALEDAKMLKEVYEYTLQTEKDFTVFAECRGILKTGIAPVGNFSDIENKNYIIEQWEENDLLLKTDSVQEVIQIILNKLGPNDKLMAAKKPIRLWNRVISASNSNSLYCGYRWKVIELE